MPSMVQARRMMRAWWELYNMKTKTKEDLIEFMVKQGTDKAEADRLVDKCIDIGWDLTELYEQYLKTQ